MYSTLTENNINIYHKTELNRTKFTENTVYTAIFSKIVKWLRIIKYL